MKPLVDIILPTWNNPQYLLPCLRSLICHTAMRDAVRIIVVNNGSPDIEALIPKGDNIVVINAGKNLGWEGGLKKGLEISESEFVCFMNDDTFVPASSLQWLNFSLVPFADAKVGAVGPTTNVVMGRQNVFFAEQTASSYPDTTYLIGYCVLLRRSALDAAGGVDDSLPGGDDLDISIRLRKAGYKLKIARPAFIYHHGFKTGERVRGRADRPGGWNSRDMSDTTNQALIRKHGFRSFFDCVAGRLEADAAQGPGLRDAEREAVRALLKGERMVELGCGAEKTDDSVIGVDRVPGGEPIPFVPGGVSKADVVADVSKPLPLPEKSFDTVIARHVLEHVLDPSEVIGHWLKLLKPDGRLVIAVPDQRISSTIPMNPEHVHAYEPKSLENLMKLFGLKSVGLAENYNGVSFTMAFEGGQN